MTCRLLPFLTLFLTTIFCVNASASLISTAFGAAVTTTCDNTGTTSAACSGTYSTPAGNDFFSSTASASYTSLEDTATASSAFTDRVDSSASSSASDAITLGGQTGAAYAEFTLYYFTDGFFGAAATTFNNIPLSSDILYFDIVVPVTFNDPFSLNVSSYVYSTTDGDGAMYSAEFRILQVALFSDAALNNPITNYNYESASEATYPFLDGTAVPEPSTVELMASAFLLVALSAFLLPKRVRIPFRGDNQGQS